MTLEPLIGLTLVDLYAGSGALGIEALSRGARTVHFVERERSALAALRENLETLGLEERAQVWPLGLPQGFKRLQAALNQADVLIADPPYGGAAARATLAALGAPGVLRAGARVVVEHHGKDELPERAGVLARERERRYGETVVSTYRAAGEDPASAEERA